SRFTTMWGLGRRELVALLLFLQRREDHRSPISLLHSRDAFGRLDHVAYSSLAECLLLHNRAIGQTLQVARRLHGRLLQCLDEGGDTGSRGGVGAGGEPGPGSGRTVGRLLCGLAGVLGSARDSIDDFAIDVQSTRLQFFQCNGSQPRVGVRGSALSTVRLVFEKHVVENRTR
ncbi:hypothetical protein PENTCL1PPCAC_18393, partial [Pristionchus entomophagus]